MRPHNPPRRRQRLLGNILALDRCEIDVTHARAARSRLDGRALAALLEGADVPHEVGARQEDGRRRGCRVCGDERSGREGRVEEDVQVRRERGGEGEGGDCCAFV